MGAIKLQSQCKNQDHHRKVDCDPEVDHVARVGMSRLSLSCSAMYLSRVPNSLPPRLQALALEAGDHDAPGGGHGNHDGSGGAGEHITFYEITVASADQPKLLSRLSEALVG